jgi:nitroreductase
MGFKDLVIKNRSCRGFDESFKITREQLVELIDCARLAPAAQNIQPLKYYLSCDEQTNALIQPITRWAGALPHLNLPYEGHRPTAFIVMCFDKTVGGICGKTLSRSTDEVTYFAGTVTNFNNKNAFYDVYVVAYSIYTDASGNEYISYVDFGTVNENYKTANLFEVTYDMYADEQSGIRSAYVDETAVWNTLMLGANVDGFKNASLASFDDITVTLVDDGKGNYLAFLRSDKEIPSEAFDSADNILSQEGYSCEIIGIVLK